MKNHVDISGNFQACSSGGRDETLEAAVGPVDRPAVENPPVDPKIAPSTESFLDSLMLWALPPAGGKPSRFEPIARRMARQMAPQDLAEEMLVAQMIATCFRAMRLSRDAACHTDRRWADLQYNHADRAHNLFRRQMQTLIDYRRPRSSSFTSIRHANIAAQQVIQSTVTDPHQSPPQGPDYESVDDQDGPGSPGPIAAAGAAAASAQSALIRGSHEPFLPPKTQTPLHPVIGGSPKSAGRGGKK